MKAGKREKLGCVGTTKANGDLWRSQILFIFNNFHKKTFY